MTLIDIGGGFDWIAIPYFYVIAVDDQSRIVGILLKRNSMLSSTDNSLTSTRAVCATLGIGVACLLKSLVSSIAISTITGYSVASSLIRHATKVSPRL